MLFERKKYLDKLIAGRGNGMVKIVTGLRRCGKSFLLFNIFARWLVENGVAGDHVIGLSLWHWLELQPQEDCRYLQVSCTD